MSHESERADSGEQAVRGLGRSSSGPSFAPPASGLPLQDRPLVNPAPIPTIPAPSRSKPALHQIVPAVGTAVILTLTVVIIIVGAVSGERPTALEVAQQTPTPEVYTAPPAIASEPANRQPDAIEFITDSGRGELRVVDHTWLRRASSSAGRLRVLVEIRALDGMIDYDPAFFFAAKDLANPIRAEDSFAHGDLDIGVLEPGKAARGYLTFRVPRGDITLMMSSDTADWVTAIKIVD